MNFSGQAPSPYSQNQQGAQNPPNHQTFQGPQNHQAQQPGQALPAAPQHNLNHPSRQHMQSQGQPMSAAAAAARRKQMAMLPPQFQNLSPQQLQDLKNQPQFQNMLRQYLQRQQMLQQQQMLHQQQMASQQHQQQLGGQQMGGQNQQLGQQQQQPQQQQIGSQIGQQQHQHQQQQQQQQQQQMGQAIQGAQIGQMNQAGIPRGNGNRNLMMDAMYNSQNGQRPGTTGISPRAINSGISPALSSAVPPHMAETGNMADRPQFNRQSVYSPGTMPGISGSMPNTMPGMPAMNAIPASMQAKVQPSQPPSAQTLQQQNQQNVQNLQNIHNQHALGVGLHVNSGANSGPNSGPASNPSSRAQSQHQFQGPALSHRDQNGMPTSGPPDFDPASANVRTPYGPGGHVVPGPRSDLAAVGSGPDDMAVAAAAAAAAAAGSAINNPGQRPEAGPNPGPNPNVHRASSDFVSEPPQIPPQFAPNSASEVPLETMTSVHQWSENAEKEGQPVSLELKMYEDLIKKDDTFMRKYEVSAGRTRQLMQKMASDIKSYGAIKQLRMNAIGASAKNQLNNSIWGEGYQGYGNGISNTATRVILPSQNKSYSRVPDIAMTEMEMNDIVMEGDKAKSKALVPIRLDFDKEKDKFKLRDTFLWDLNEQVLPLESFVKTLIEDYKFIPESHFHDIYQSITEQIKDFRMKPANTMGEIRIPIKIDLLINNTQFTDQFEWDILNYHETDPEEFASVLCDEMSLPGEFATAIAFSIREQSSMYHKALFLVGYTFDGSPIREDEIRGQIGPPLRVLKPDSTEEDFVTALRNPALLVDYSPSMSKLSHQEIEKIDKEMERESRRRRRQLNTETTFSYNENGNNNFTGMARGTASRRSALHSGRGAKTSLPNLTDIPKMFRTPMPSSVLPGGVDLGVPDIFGYNEFIVNRSQVPNPDHKPPAPSGMVTSFKDTAGSFFVRIRLPRKR